jgi:hypothetical protein
VGSGWGHENLVFERELIPQIITTSSRESDYSEKLICRHNGLLLHYIGCFVVIETPENARTEVT